MIDIVDQDEDEKALASVVAVGTETRRNLKPKHKIAVAKDGKPGTVAHYHEKSDDNFTWEDPCYFVESRVRCPEGIKLNEVLFSGKVVVPQCTADYLAWLDNERLRYEQGIFRSRKINKKVATLGG